MPTSVAVDADGIVYVADGVNSRIARFDVDGRLLEDIRSVGELRLNRPIGVKLDASGRLWIADTGNHRVLIRKSDGTLDRIVTPRIGSGSANLDITDMLPLGDGQMAWLVDNEHHRLIHLSSEQSELFVVGSKGEPLGRFHFPFAMARNSGGDLLVVDVLNARVVVLNASGVPVSFIGGYGVEPGQLYRPKGIAVDGQDRVWVSDSVLGVVQAFTSTGRFVDVLRDPQGEPMRFDAPMGLAFDREGLLYVVELNANRVKQIAISGHGKPSPRRPRPSARAAQPRMCTVCHIEWMEPFASGKDSALMKRPATSADDPVVSRSPLCLSCHDGSVADSRRRVWSEHGHQVGIAPPDSMQVPGQLPLDRGRLACRTCHTAHAGGPSAETDLASVFFMRLPTAGGELCTACHQQQSGGTTMGSHPVGGMPWPIPEALIQAGAQVGPNPRVLTCQVCHTAHGSTEQQLLVMGTSSSELCLTCHRELRPGLWRAGAPHDHPQNPPLSNDTQRRAIAEMGTRVGSDDTLICLSCHKIHRAEEKAYLLADTLTDSSLCVRCHPDRSAMFNSPHDLRISAPQERNRLGQTPQTSGPCGACHSFHQFARARNPQPIDPDGLCTTCHAKGQCAAGSTFAVQSHPLQIPIGTTLPADLNLPLLANAAGEDRNSLLCLTCHDPHVVRHGQFLRREPDQLCRQCHADQATTLAGAHDLSRLPDAKNGFGRTAVQTGSCGFCHAMHDAKGLALWAATDRAPRQPSDLCYECHKTGGVAASQPVRDLRHPSGPEITTHTRRVGNMLPLFDRQADRATDGFMTCATCHDIHGSSKTSPDLLRHPAGIPSLCAACHDEALTLDSTLHRQGRLQDMPTYAHTSLTPCEACHAVHARVGMNPQGMWAAPLGSAEYSSDMQLCLGCHSARGGANMPRVVVHPAMPMRNVAVAGESGFMPLADDAGRLGPQGRVTCQTCHLPHGRHDAPAMPTTLPGTTPEERMRALATMLRPFTIPNLCTSCHGEEALTRYLYYHHPEKRRPK